MLWYNFLSKNCNCVKYILYYTFFHFLPIVQLVVGHPFLLSLEEEEAALILPYKVHDNTGVNVLTQWSKKIQNKRKKQTSFLIHFLHTNLLLVFNRIILKNYFQNWVYGILDQVQRWVQCYHKHFFWGNLTSLCTPTTIGSTYYT